MTGGINSGSQEIIKAFQAEGAKTAAEVADESQDASKAAFQAIAQRGEVTKAPRKTLKEKLQTVQKTSDADEKADTANTKKSKESTDNAAKKFQQKNPELKSNVLVLLRSKIKDDDSPEEILKKVREVYYDVSLADEALDFLLTTTDTDLQSKVQQAKDEFNQASGREIAAGRNIATEARTAASGGLGTPTDLREMYREITGNPRDANTLFNEFAAKYPYKAMLKVTEFLLHSMGADMNAKGPSIPRGELHNILTEVRTIQAILGVYRFFNSRMNLVRSMMTNESLTVPKELNFENLAKCFMSLTAERYPTSDKVLQSGKRLGVSDSLPAQIVAFSQFRDAVRQVSVQLIYRSPQHRDEVFNAIIETLEGLEDQLDEMLEQLDDDDDEITPMDVENRGQNQITPMDIDEENNQGGIR